MNSPSLPRIGILGGMGPLVTQFFLGLLLDILKERRHPRRDQDFPDITLLMESSMPDRTKALREDPDPVRSRIDGALTSLERAGCSVIAVPCITAHAFIDPSWFNRGVVDFREHLLPDVRDGTRNKAGVLATDGTVSSNVLSPLTKKCDLVFPDRDHQTKVMDLVYSERGLKASRMDAGYCRSLMEELTAYFSGIGAGYILTGCTEIEEFVVRNRLEGTYLLPMNSMCHEISRRL